MALPTTIPLTAARALALHTQGLGTTQSDRPAPDRDAILGMVKQVACVQIDTLQMVHRSHYLALWSRLGTYDTADFDALIYGSGKEENDRQCFEYWLHAASIIPLEEYRFSIPHMQHYHESPSRRYTRWLAQSGGNDILPAVYQRIADEGALRASDFKQSYDKGGTWWNWKPSKIALEALYNRGDAMIANRINFQRIYDLKERVLPDWVDTTPPSEAEVYRHYVERAVQSFGICWPRHAAALAYFKQADIRDTVQTLTTDGTFVEVETALLDGSTDTLIIHRDNLPLLEQACDGDLPARRTTFLSPFDSLTWPKERDLKFWGFLQVLEAYKRAPDRIWGYFCLPILHNDRLVGRFDPKLERKTGALRLKALYLEPGIEPDDKLVADVAAAIKDFLKFHNATDVVIEKSDPAPFGKKLLAAL